MSNSITLAADIPADRAHLFRILSTTEGQRAFWTADCEVGEDRARFGFEQAPADLVTSVTTESDTLVRMQVLSGFPFWEGSTWEWTLAPAQRAASGTSVVFRHYGFGEGYPDADLGYTAQTWALILDRLGAFAVDGTPRPYFGVADANSGS